MKNILLALTILISGLITYDLFLKEPPIWPDEPSLIYIINVFDGNIIKAYLNYPSIHTALIFYCFKFFGVSIEAQRALSVIAGIITVIIFVLFVNQLVKNRANKGLVSSLPIILLITDFTFLQSTRIGRPEIFTLLFGLSSIYLLFLYVLRGFNQLTALGLCFLTTVAAFLFHANGFIYVLNFILMTIICFKKMTEKNRKIITLFAFCASFFGAFMGFRIIPNILTRLQFSISQEGWLINVFTSKPLEFKLLYLSFILTTLLFTVFTYQKKKLILLTIFFPLLMAWLILIFNKELWYAVYLIPLIILALFIMLENSYRNMQITKSFEDKFKFLCLLLICSVIFFSNIKIHINILFSEGGDKYSYHQYISNIKQIIPDNKSVFTSAIPDPYYAFLDRKNNNVIRFPQSPIARGVFLEMLNESDYIIYNGSFSNLKEDLVLEYFKLNFLKLIQVGGPDQYNAVVVELKPRNQRINP